MNLLKVHHYNVLVYLIKNVIVSTVSFSDCVKKLSIITLIYHRQYLLGLFNFIVPFIFHIITAYLF
jgi:hypothetical protein